MPPGVPQAGQANFVPLGDPGPLGLAAFAMTTFVLSVFNAGLLDVKLEAVFLPLALFYGGIVQVLAGMWEFRMGNTFGAVAFSSYGAFWVSLFWLVRYVVPTLPASNVLKGVGLFLLAWTIFTAYMMIASFRLNGVLAVVFVALFLTFLALTVGRLGGSTGMIKLGGWLGLVTAAAGWYGSFAGVTNATFKRSVVPVFPLAARA